MPRTAVNLGATLESRFLTWQRELSSPVRQNILVPYSGETRIVTVLFADCSRVDCSRADASRAAPTDEPDSEPVDGLLRVIVDVLAPYEGRIDRFLGNRALAVFGAPLAHEDDAERAVLAALELREKARARGWNVSAGIATGLIAHGSVGADEHHEMTVMGPAVNLAAQLQSKARANDIVVGQSTRRQVFRAFKVTPVLRTTDETAAPAAWRVERRLERPEKARGIEGLRAALVGRDEELNRLVAVHGDVEGGSGRMVSIIGEAGVGKSRLVAELKRRVQRRSIEKPSSLWLEGRCLEVGVTRAYGPFIDLLGQHFGFAQPDSGSRRAKRMLDALEELRRGGRIPAERVQEIGPLMGKLLSIHFGTEWDTELTYAPPAQVKHQTILAIRDVLLALAAQRPLVVVLDDLERADELSIDVISLLMGSLAPVSLLLLCVYRPEQDQKCWQLSSIASRACPQSYTEIVLRELTSSQSRRLILSLLSADVLPTPVRESILTQSQGNPLFVEEMIRAMIDSGVVYRDGDRWRAREDARAVLVPETLRSIILSRVDRLDRELKRILESASVIGRLFHRQVLERTLERQRALAEPLAELEKRALIRPQKAAVEQEYSFTHVLMQQIIYQSIPSHRRRLLHGRAAEAIETLSSRTREERIEQLAYHHERAGNTQQAVECLISAGEKARDAYLNEGAIGHFRRALELLGASGAAAGTRRFQVLCEMGTVYEVIGRHDQAEARLREAVDLGCAIGTPPHELARAHYLLCKTLTARHRPQEYVPIAQESLALLAGDQDSVEAVFAEFVVAYGSFDKGDFSALCDYAVRRGPLIRRMPYSREMSLNSSYLAWALFVNKNDTQALGWLDWLEREARQHNDLMSLAAAHIRRGRDVLAPRGDLTGAVAAIERAIALYRKIGARYLEAQCHLWEGDVYYRFGRLEEAEECARSAAAVGGDLEQKAHLEVESGLLAGQIALSRDDPHSALAFFQGALRAAPGEQWEWLLRFLVGCTLLQQNRDSEASRFFLSVLGSTLTFRLPPAYTLTIDLAHVLSALEQSDAGGGRFREACDLVQRKRPQSRSLLAQWYLEPAQPAEFPSITAHEDLRKTPGPAWAWHAQDSDCEHRVEGGLVVRAAVGRGLWGANLGAPRLLRAASGDLTVRVACGAGGHGRPVVGGVLMWKDERNYLRLDRGSMGERNVLFSGCIANADVMIGRGRLGADCANLLLERRGPIVRALCSSDGTNWYTVGEAAFPVEDPLELGLFADGAARPEIYPRSYCSGSEILFTDVWLSEPTITGSRGGRCAPASPGA